MAGTLAGHYVTDPHHTFVHFSVLHFGTSTVWGRFDNVAGEVDLREDGSGTATMRIAMDSISTGLPQFDHHLRSADFFDAERHPQSLFEVDGLQIRDGELAQVAGRLTLLGQTHPLTLRCLRFNAYDSPLLNAHVVGGDFEVSMQRSQWGMRWGLELGVPDEVRLRVQIEAARQ